jgi:hypothetical protein
VQKTGTHTKIRPPSLGPYYSLEKWRGYKLKTICESGIIVFLSGFLMFYGTELKIGTDPDLFFPSLRIQITITVPTQFYQPFYNSFLC